MVSVVEVNLGELCEKGCGNMAGWLITLGVESVSICEDCLTRRMLEVVLFD